MKTITVNGRNFVISISSAEIENAVVRIAEELNRDMAGKNPLFLVLLNGAFVFASDLLRRFDHECNISFIKLASYRGTQTTACVKELIGLVENVNNRTVVIVEDIIDTGITVDKTIDILKKCGAADVKIAALLFKPKAFKKNFIIDYLGISIPNDFIVGYGLDYDGCGRNYPDIYRLQV
jgi:hypoxanthine phosphoribosyltransferase